MPRGFGVVNTAREDINRRQAAGGGPRKRYFKLKDGESAIVRFLEQSEEVNCAWVHKVPVAGMSWPLKVPCIDQDDEGRRNLGKDCPGCEKGYDIAFRGVINMIQRDAPVFEKDEDGNYKKDSRNQWIPTGETEDAVVVWDQGITVFEELNEKDAVYNGLRSRDFRIKRRGNDKNTTYSIEPAYPDGGPQPMSENDKRLAEEKPNLDDLVVPEDYATWGTFGRQQETIERPESKSPFLRRLEGNE